MQDPLYRNFMISLIQNLEPVRYRKGYTMISELDEVHQLTFIHKGKVGIGFEINKMKKVAITVVDKLVMGGFYVSFN